MTERNATTQWTGDLKSGSGNVALESSAAGTFPVTWASRAEAPEGRTSPEELIAAAHSSCYSMQLSGLLTAAGTPPESISTSAEVSFGPRGDGFAITGIALTVRARVPSADAASFDEAARKAKDICPVSAALTGTTISLDAALE
ncbi:osmotically inducible protein OsmC [Saccharopolyspora erythraea NRRL 2338]|uniref:Osmotically inducible protein C, OsmC n=2 Tax=Saccharopolyspora erythraea TaxID=1836 RepID=A4FQ05_SACEN|nr:OsmC family peroxiredoxin [Saccharopolyspora erythraea]EQD84322.1 peroxiredoxin [Saccharopolyspora erythraea D]PFG99776.1 osmotically inducible protein OsmC [Saccharopolyspora erythraea NRRL 2338]QRK89649.1 OsmC family peroxiredoxin [Saccharopolyspora erythraea]CAM06130.1 osmotically inducible protein C, OsmC [Saccharopolyspora erythraea NRRL 2338]